MAITSKSQSTQFSESDAAAPGAALGGGILNSIFGVDQRLVGGQFIAGPKTPFVPLSDAELKGRLKAMGHKNVTLKNKQSKGRLFEDFQNQLRAEHEATQGDFFGAGGASGGGGFGGFGQSILGLANQEAGPSFEALLGIIEGGGNPTDVSAIQAANFTDLKERFSGLGGLFSSDFQASAQRDAAELGVAAQENAQSRLLSALGLSQSFDPLGFDVANTQGGRELSLFKSLFQPQSTNAFSAGADSSSFSSSRSDGGLGGLLGAGLGAAGNVVGGAVEGFLSDGVTDSVKE